MINLEKEIRQSRQAAEDITKPTPSNTEEYIQAQRDALRNQVLERSRTENFHVRPILGYDQEGKPYYTTPEYNAWACLYSATNLYGKPYRQASNKLFAGSPEKYGFKRVSSSEILPGDIVQYGVYDEEGRYWPAHGMIYDHTGADNYPRFNYSSGNWDAPDGSPSQTKHKAKYADEELSDKGSWRVYRFVGKPEDELRWAQEWRDTHPVTKIQANPLDVQVHEHHSADKH